MAQAWGPGVGRGEGGAGTRSGEFEEHLLDVRQGIALVGSAIGIGEAPREPGGDEDEAGLLERLDRRRQLRDDVPAVTTVRQHLLHPTNLTLGASQALREISNGLFW